MKRRSDFWGGGGKHQRLARAEILGGLLGQAASSNEPIRPEDLRPGPLDGDDEVDTLLELWAMGLLSATLLQNIAASACNVAPRPQMTALKNLGSGGVHQGNAHRDLQRKLNMGNLDSFVATPLFVKLPLRDTRRLPATKKELSYPILLPHEFLSVMYENNRTIFDTFIVGAGNLVDFWSHVREGDPRLSGHPVKRKADKSRVVPLRIHGDGVPVGKGKNKSMDILSFSSMSGLHGCTWDTKILMLQ